MKILFISHYYFPHIGGVEKHLCELSRSINNISDAQITIITSKHDYKLKSDEIIENVMVKRIKYPETKVIGLFVIWLKMLSLIKLFYTYDVIHIHDVFIWCLPIRIIFFWKKFFITFHGYESYPLRKKHIYLRRLAARLTTRNICVGKFIEKWYGISADKIIYGAVDTSVFYPQNNRKRYDAIFSGRLDEQTGIDVYVKAVNNLREEYKNFNLVVLGEGKYRKYIPRVIKTVGFIENTSSYYKDAELAFVSRYLAIFEAFATKILVFAVYDNPIKHDYLTLTPFRKMINICNNKKDLIERIKYFKNNQKKGQEMVNKAYSWVIKKNWTWLAYEYLDLWKIKI